MKTFSIPMNRQHSNRTKRIICLLLMCLLAIAQVYAPAIPGKASSSWAESSSPVYTDGLSGSWQDWSYGGVSVNLANTSQVHSGSTSVSVQYTGGWSGFQIGYGGNTLDASLYDKLRFWIHGGSTGGQAIQLQIQDHDGNTSLTENITPQANTWKQVDVSLSSMGSPRSVYTIAWFNNTSGSQAVFYLDDISFISSTVTPTPTSIPGTGPALSVDVSANRHAISPYIYGMNYASQQVANVINLPVRRWGGNSATRYNWQINVHNTGSDWYYENIPDADADSADSFVVQNNATNTDTLMTIPLIGWTPKRRLADHPFDCAFKVSLYGPQDSVDPWDTYCGNGIQNGVQITGNDPADTSVAITSSFVTDWVSHLTSTFGTAANGGVMFYNLDNEPGIWNGTHQDIHPQATTYDEMRDRTYAYAAALKAADPTALTLGPVEDGWCRYFFSGADDCNPNGADRAAHGNMDYVAWYLQQMRMYEQAHNVRILDYLDLHIYPQGNGIFSDSLGSTSVQALRLRSTRQLWDPTYVDESWIGGTGWENGTVMLIPRMKSWVNSNYPGTKLAITEYNWGALDTMNGALAQADVLGIFGREGLDLATLWDPPTNVDAPGIFAFRMYRNYDGNNGQFGDVSVGANSSDQAKLAIYAAQRTSDSALTLIVVNKTSQTLTSTLSLANYPSSGVADVYRYSSANLTSIVHAAGQVVTSSGFTAAFPANSITLFVLHPTPLVTIAGNTHAGGATLYYLDGTFRSVTADDGGNYSLFVSSGWSGTVTPYKSGYTFTPSQRSYTDIRLELTSQDYTAQACASCIAAPAISHILRASVNPSSANSVDFAVHFSKPVTGVDATDFTLTKTGVTGASIQSVSGSGDKYNVTVNTGSGNGTIRLDVVDDNSIVDAAGNPLGGDNVGDGNFNSGEAYTVVKSTAKPSIPILLAPANGTLFTTLQPDLDWKDTTPVADHYQLQVATNKSFTALTVNKAGIPTSAFSFDEDLQPGMLYYWRVKAFNIIEGSLGWSMVRTFKTPLAATMLVAPTDAASLIVTRPSFDWANVNGANKYVLQVSTTHTFGTLLLNVTVGASEYIMMKDLPLHQTQYWRVKAQNSAVNGPWSAIQSFKTGSPASIPVLLAPANNGLVKDLTPLLDWKDSTLPAGTIFKYYEFELDVKSDFSTSTVVTRTVSDYTPTSDLDSNTSYYWRVRAVNTVTVNSVPVDHLSAWSQARSFRTVIASPQSLSVVPNALKPLQPTLDWVDATGPGTITSYTIQISTDANFAALRVNTTTKESLYKLLKDLPTGKSLYWRVRVNGTNGPSAWRISNFTLPLP